MLIIQGFAKASRYLNAMKGHVSYGGEILDGMYMGRTEL
jgi:hypothetical protein